MNHTDLVVLDPTAPGGEAALDVIELGDRVALYLALHGPSAAALREFAAVEEISLTEASEIYAEQVTQRLADAGHTAVTTYIADGGAPVEELLDAIEATGSNRVAVPADTNSFTQGELGQVRARTTAQVLVTA